MRIIVLLALFGLAACGASVGQTTTADGRRAYLARCGGPFGAKIDCNIAATQTCPSGYEPLDSAAGTLTFACAQRPVPPRAPFTP